MSDDVGSSCLLFMNPSFSLEECINDF
jgi:hypothetical protein